jgi:hypothetical protein
MSGKLPYWLLKFSDGQWEKPSSLLASVDSTSDRRGAYRYPSWHTANVRKTQYRDVGVPVSIVCVRRRKKRNRRKYKAVLAYLLDRREQYPNDSGTYHAITELIDGLAREDHLVAYAHGEYDDLLSDLTRWPWVVKA